MEKTMETAAYKVLLEGGQGEIVEKKSRFIATVRSCETEEGLPGRNEEEILGCQTQLLRICAGQPGRVHQIQ